LSNDIFSPLHHHFIPNDRMIFSKISQLLLSSLLFGLVTASVAAEKLKVATVDMGTLVRQYHRYQSAQKEKQLEIESIREAERERLLGIQALEEELNTMVKEMKDPSFSLAKRNAIREEAAVKQADLQALERELNVFLNRRDQELREKMATLQNEIVQDVMEKVNAYAETREVDLVLDESGISTTEVPFLIYVREKIDLTDPVLKLLNADAPESGDAQEKKSSSEGASE
jgi:Skp family chaperone for outer membrane proteins